MPNGNLDVFGHRSGEADWGPKTSNQRASMSGNVHPPAAGFAKFSNNHTLFRLPQQRNSTVEI